MAKYSSSQFSVFLVDGYNLLGAGVKSVSHKVVNVLQSKVEGLGDAWAAHSATGILRGEFTQQGAFLDDTVLGLHDAFKGLTQTVRILVAAWGGNTIGKMFAGFQGVYEGDYALGPKVAALTLADTTYAVSGQSDRGVIVQNWVQRAASWNTFTDGFPVDYTLDPDNLATPITSNSIANPTVVTTPVPHKLTTGDVILISGVITSTPAINGQLVATVITPTTFSVPVNVTVAGTGGSFVRASMNNGGVAYQVVSQYAGITGLVGKIRSSADNITGSVQR